MIFVKNKDDKSQYNFICVRDVYQYVQLKFSLLLYFSFLHENIFGENKIPDLILNEKNGQNSLEGLLRRNELVNPSLALKLNELIQANKKLISEIEKYLNQ